MTLPKDYAALAQRLDRWAGMLDCGLTFPLREEIQNFLFAPGEPLQKRFLAVDMARGDARERAALGNAIGLLGAFVFTNDDLRPENAAALRLRTAELTRDGPARMRALAKEFRELAPAKQTGIGAAGAQAIDRTDETILEWLAKKPKAYHAMEDIAAGAFISRKTLSGREGRLFSLRERGLVMRKGDRGGHAITPLGLEYVGAQNTH